MTNEITITKNQGSSYHQPVLVAEVLEYLAPKRDAIFVDGTLGAGGHVKAVLDQIKTCNLKLKTRVIGIDRDNEAIDEAKKILSKYSNITFIKDNFVNIDKILNKLKIKKVDAILLDLGVSSHQLDDISRGFSFKDQAQDAVLDMRMDKTSSKTAKDVLNSYSRNRLAEIFLFFGGIGSYKKLASKILQRRRKRRFETIRDLLVFLEEEGFKKSHRRHKIHFATDVFRALRMEVNDEIQSLVDVIPKAIDALKVGGRLAIISFHSKEDTIVKHSFKMFANDEVGLVKILTKKPIPVSEKERSINPRSRSAKLRVVEKLHPLET